MFARALRQALRQPRSPHVCLVCAAQAPASATQFRLLSSTPTRLLPAKSPKKPKPGLAAHQKRKRRRTRAITTPSTSRIRSKKTEPEDEGGEDPEEEPDVSKSDVSSVADANAKKTRKRIAKKDDKEKAQEPEKRSVRSKGETVSPDPPPPVMSLKQALLRGKGKKNANLNIKLLSPKELDFTPVEHKIPPVPMLSYGLDRVLFNPGVYRLQDPRSRVYNFDPYLEKILPVADFDFDALSEYKTSSKDEDLLAITRRLGTKFTGSTSSMSGALQHFHYVLSNWRPLNHDMLSRKFPASSKKFSRVTIGPSAIFLRYKDGLYAIDADKSYDTPNIMSWMGHSLEKLLTTSRNEFERYRRSTPEEAPGEDESGKCYHYSQLGNFLMRSQLDAYDPRLPGSGIFDLKTRAVVSIRMDHDAYETGSGYQLRFDQGEWESYEREFYDMTRATMLKYSLQVRMGRMDGIFVAYHNVERMFGFQYLSLSDMDRVLHGQSNTCLGDQEFRLSLALLEELLERATEKFPETSIRLHFEAVGSGVPYLYCFAEPVSEEQADEIQNTQSDLREQFERDVIGISREDRHMQADWQKLQERVDAEVVDDALEARTSKKQNEEAAETEEDAEDVEDTQNVKEVEDIEETPPAEQVSDEEEVQETLSTESVDSPNQGPFTGWTLTVRSRVNGVYVDRPEPLESKDDWDIEYHIKEIEEPQASVTFSKLKERRKNLVGQSKEDQAKDLRSYREFIHKFSKSGRKWRNKQDKIDEEMGVRVYRPLGPGADEVIRQLGGQQAAVNEAEEQKSIEVVG